MKNNTNHEERVWRLHKPRQLMLALFQLGRRVQEINVTGKHLQHRRMSTISLKQSVFSHNFQ